MNVKKYIHHSFILSLAVILLFVGFIKPNSASAAAGSLSIDAKSAILVDSKSGKILYAKNIDEQLPPASMTKMMTEYLVLKALDEGKIKKDTVVPISKEVSETSKYFEQHNFSGFTLRPDYTYTVDHIFEALLIPSSNIAAIALAQLVGGGDESKFVDMMNKTAKEMGMTHTKYINSSGLDNVDLGPHIAKGGPNDTDLTTARDLAKLAYHMMNDFSPELMDWALKIASTAEMDFKAGPDEINHMVNTNWMLTDFSAKGNNNMKIYEYPGVDGFKTGYTSLAGYCFTGTVQKGDRRFISVVMNTKSEGARFIQTKKLYDYGFNQTEEKKVLDKGYSFKEHKAIPVNKGKKDKVNIETKSSVTIPVESGNGDKYKPVLHLDKSLLDKDGNLTAPVKKGQKVGYVTLENTSSNKYGYLYDKGPKVDIIASEDVEKSNWFVLTLKSIGHFFSSIFTGAVDLVKGWF